ncbi:MAG: hypothetical protein DI571_05120 [Arsenicicoccus sp.]|nr:MAG: hypothetical protein DI571_05120 [Arsenicicoccus sp.]
MAYRARRASLQIHDDGTATLEVTSSVVSLVAAHTRIERAARLLRKQGDPRTLDQLRADTAAALLVHGQLPQPEPTGHPDTTPTDTSRHPAADQAGEPGSVSGSTLAVSEDDLVAPDLEAMARVICGMPTIELHVVVPFDALAGRASHPTCRHPSTDDTAATRHGEVGFLLGRHPAYLSPGQAREFALLPGTTLSRLLTDPADGRLIERSTTSYRPDAAMRRQVLAADVTSRAPGSRHPAAVCEIDHVTPWSSDSPGGATAETNLVALAKRHHDLKTRALAFTALNTRRDLRWTTLLGQSETTRTHDYRQYTHHPQPTTARGERHLSVEELRDAVDRLAPLKPDPDELAGPADAPDQHPSQRADLDDRRDLLNRAFYAALAHRGPDAFLLDTDDHPGSTEHGGPLSGWMWITRTTPSGRRRTGAHPDTPTLRTVLGLPPETDPPHTDPPHTNPPDTNPPQPWTDTHDEPPPF